MGEVPLGPQEQVHWLGQVNISTVHAFSIVFSSRHDFMGFIYYHNGLKREKRWEKAVKLDQSDQKLIVKVEKPTNKHQQLRGNQSWMAGLHRNGVGNT